VERRIADSDLFSQYDRASDRVDWEPHADGDSIPAAAATGEGDLPYPVAPQKWHFRQSIDYSITANRAVLDVASKHREDFLLNIYRMGKNSIERGSRDHWTITPKRIAEVQAAIAKEMPQAQSGGGEGQGRRAAAAAGDAPPGDAPQGFGGQARGVPVKYYELLRKPEKRDPRGFVIPSNQPDFLTATKFINVLIKTGITVHRGQASSVLPVELSCRVIRSENRASFPAPHPRYVRATGSSG
jgi:hypothetical protein